MGKPLLTDDIIEQAKRGEILPTRAVELRMPNAINFNTSLIASSFGLWSS